MKCPEEGFFGVKFFDPPPLFFAIFGVPSTRYVVMHLGSGGGGVTCPKFPPGVGVGLPISGRKLSKNNPGPDPLLHLCISDS